MNVATEQRARVNAGMDQQKKAKEKKSTETKRMLWQCQNNGKEKRGEFGANGKPTTKAGSESRTVEWGKQRATRIWKNTKSKMAKIDDRTRKKATKDKKEKEKKSKIEANSSEHILTFCRRQTSHILCHRR